MQGNLMAGGDVVCWQGRSTEPSNTTGNLKKCALERKKGARHTLEQVFVPVLQPQLLSLPKSLQYNCIKGFKKTSGFVLTRPCLLADPV